MESRFEGVRLLAAPGSSSILSSRAVRSRACAVRTSEGSAFPLDDRHFPPNSYGTLVTLRCEPRGRYATSMKCGHKVASEVLRFLRAWVVGTLGCGVSGAILTTILFWLGGNLQRVEGFGSPHLYSAAVGFFYGACLGALATPIAYPSYLRKNPLRPAFFVPAIISLCGLLLILLLIPLASLHG